MPDTYGDGDDLLWVFRTKQCGHQIQFNHFVGDFWVGEEIERER